MNWAQIGPTFVISATLAAFGYFYNHWVAGLESDGRDEGITALLVVGGVAATLLGIGALDVYVDWNAGIIGLVCFTASGLPMVVGSLSRYAKLREQQIKTTLGEILGGKRK